MIYHAMNELYKDRPEPYQAARLKIRGTANSSQTSQPVSHRIEVAGIGDYHRQEWDEESYALFAEGGDPGACPDCGRTGFYGPRFADPEERFRDCRFCGFFQMVDVPARRYVPTAHDCETWPEVSQVPYIWWVSPDLDAFDCPFCTEPILVDSATVPSPIDTPKHPWWKIPQGRSQPFYQRLWRNWAWSTGRTIL
jgi:hypothetical protein